MLKRLAMAVSGLCMLVATSVHAGVWNNQYINFKGGSLRVVVHDNMLADMPRTTWLINMADKSTVTTNPINSTTTAGLIKPGDILAVNENMLMWIDCTVDSPQPHTLNGGGGMLRGLWEIKRDATGNHNFERVINAYNYSPNLLYAGSVPGFQGGGMSILGNYNADIDDGWTWGIEHNPNPNITAFTGTDTPDDEVFIQVNGYMANSPGIAVAGIESIYDMDTRVGVEGRSFYTVTYRVPATGTKFRQEISFTVTQNQMGPIGTISVCVNAAGYPGVDYTWGSNVLLDGASQFVFSRDYTTYYSSPAGMKFYEKSVASNPAYVHWGSTPDGTGTVISHAALQQTYPSPFIQTTLDYSPWQFSSEYRLQIIDNKLIIPDPHVEADHEKYRVEASEYKAFNAGEHGAYTFAQGENFLIILDYELK